MIPNLEVHFQIIISALLGIVLGLNRIYKNKSAGLKTFMFVSVSCTLITIVSIESAEIFGDSSINNRMDPMRLSAQIVSGLGFLGAGIIIKDGLRVTGLTSAAMLFFAGGVGIVIGVKFYEIVIFSVLITLVLAKFCRFIEDKIEGETKGATENSEKREESNV